MNSTLAEKARCIRLNAGLSKVFWAEAVNTTSFIINISPTADNDFNILQENETEVCEDSPKEKSIVEVELDEDNLPSDKDNDEDDSQEQQQEKPYSIARGREKQVHKAPQIYGFEDMVSFALVTSSGDPLFYREATNKKHSDKWLVAMCYDPNHPKTVGLHALALKAWIRVANI
uniref:Uncharacterized protein n=1 Tax=Fagus sylvatica TaxID=28930 RepID=A0A2N9I414_FAGSY